MTYHSISRKLLNQESTFLEYMVPKKFASPTALFEMQGFFLGTWFHII